MVMHPLSFHRGRLTSVHAPSLYLPRGFPCCCDSVYARCSDREGAFHPTFPTFPTFRVSEMAWNIIKYCTYEYMIRKLQPKPPVI